MSEHEETLSPVPEDRHTELRESFGRLQEQVSSVIVGQEDMVQLLMVALLCKGHVLIEGYPGLAKTLTARIISRSIDTEFKRIQFTPDLMPSDLIGTNVFNLKTSEFNFVKGPVFSNIVLIDEINRAPAKTQSALFEVMEERQATVDGVPYRMEEPFLIVGTQNPIDLEGTYPLPEAQMDRFIFKINIGYPSLQEEAEILRRHQGRPDLNKLDWITPVLSDEALREYQTKVPSIHASEEIVGFISRLVHSTRDHQDILIGASPRASLALFNGAKALSVLKGRDFVTPDDVKDLAVPVLNHRIVLTAEKEMEGGKVSQVISQLLKMTEVPR